MPLNRGSFVTNLKHDVVLQMTVKVQMTQAPLLFI